MNKSELQACHLTCVRGGRVLFSELQLSLQAGEVLQVVGANGSGKTSLLRILAGLLTPQSGAVYWQGQPITAQNNEYRQALGYLGHKNAVKTGLTVLEHIQLYAQLQQRPFCKATAEVLQQFALWKLRQRRGETLSAGQKQRLALARLALTAPRLWILDEPFTALDIQAAQEWLNCMTQHIQQGGMIVLTSHQTLAWQSVAVKQLTLDVTQTARVTPLREEHGNLDSF